MSNSGKRVATYAGVIATPLALLIGYLLWKKRIKIGAEIIEVGYGEA